MISVLQLKADPAICQWIYASDPTRLEIVSTDGMPRSDQWDPPKFYVQKPFDPKSNFFVTYPGSFAFDQNVMDNAGIIKFFEASGEILPIKMETGEMLYILNVTEVNNCLDHEKTTFRVYPHSGYCGAPKKYAFHSFRMPLTDIFKIPETARSQILTVTGLHSDPIEEFKSAYDVSGLTGLKFIKLWSDDPPKR